MKLRRWLVITVLFCGGLLALSGEWRSPIVWTYLVGLSATVLSTMLSIESDLANERLRPPSPGADRVALIWIRLMAFGAAVVAPLDGGRFHWSTPLPPAWRLAAFIGSIVAFALCLRAMAVNRYFSTVIRIQSDRGHRVVDSGPYSIIRHPGYAGMIAGLPLMAIGFGSWWGFAFACAYSLLILRRVAKEDRFLGANLTGYPEYAARVPSRLVPGVW